MRYRINDYGVTITELGVILSFTVPKDADIDYDSQDGNSITQVGERRIMEALRLIIDETAHVVFSSSMNKGYDDATGAYTIIPSGQYDPGVGLYDISLYVVIANDATITDSDNSSITYRTIKNKTYTVSDSDMLTIEFDWGDEPAGLSGGGGGELEPATDAEYAAFKSHMQTQIATILTPIQESNNNESE